MTPSADIKKFRILSILTIGLVILILSYNVFQEYFMPQVEGYLERRGYRQYYENVISKKGLSMHKGMYWKEKE